MFFLPHQKSYYIPTGLAIVSYCLGFGWQPRLDREHVMGWAGSTSSAMGLGGSRESALLLYCDSETNVTDSLLLVVFFFHSKFRFSTRFDRRPGRGPPTIAIGGRSNFFVLPQHRSHSPYLNLVFFLCLRLLLAIPCLHIYLIHRSVQYNIVVPFFPVF